MLPKATAEPFHKLDHTKFGLLQRTLGSREKKSHPISLSDNFVNVKKLGLHYWKENVIYSSSRWRQNAPWDN